MSVRPLAIGATAYAALARTAGRARVLARLRTSTYLTAGDDIVWLGAAGAVLHPRAVLTRRTLDLETDDVHVDLDALTPWRPPPVPPAAALAVNLAGGWTQLAAGAAALGTPAGFGDLLVGAPLAFPLDGARAAAEALAQTCAGDDAAGATDAALGLLGLGGGLTPSGDDFVGGAFFARALLAGARLADPGAWRRAADAVLAAAPARTHPISVALLGDLVTGQGWAVLHDLVAALAPGVPSAARAAARRLVTLGHTSGWDLLAGLGAGLGALTVGRPAPSFGWYRRRQIRGTVSGHSDPTGGPVDPYRLPRAVVPSRYDIRLEPDLTTLTFRGEETIAVSVAEAVSEIVFNAVELAVDEAVVVDAGGREQRATVGLDEASERCRLAFAEPLAVGAGRLRLAFRGTLNDKLRGFYRSVYKDPSGVSRTMAATQFEATDARRAFPCWDEPAFKAVFSVTLAIDPALTVVSNTRILSETREGARKIVRFADSIVMSTYLVAIVVGELEHTEPTLVGATPVSIWCVPGKRRLAAFGQEIAVASLRYFEEYYGLPYPGDKLDLLAVPDFAAGAMENLGAITFRETALLVDEQAASHAELQRVADVVAHENAHMWFGDLVTMSWWNGIWLNEAFATFMEMLAVDAWKPEWQRWVAFGVSRAAALSVDGLHSTRSIEFPVRAPREADAMFDVLTYEKGASVLRMLEQYLGPEVFRAGVRDYLTRHRFANADTGDLWAALGRASQQPIPAVMDGWIFAPGYPVVSVSVEGGELVLRQQRFTYLAEPLRWFGATAATATAPARWQVPVRLRLAAGGRETVERVLLTEPQTRRPLPAGFESVVANEGGHGFYRVRYDEALRERLLSRLPSLGAIERFNLVNDAWAVTVAGLMPLPQYLDLTARFRDERDKNVWSVLIGSLHTLNRLVTPADRPQLEALVRDRAAPALAALGWTPRGGDDELTRQLRGDLVRALGTLGNDRAVQARAAELYAGHERGAAPVDPNVLPALIAVLAHAGDEGRYHEFFERFRTATTPQEEQRYLYALTAFPQPALVEQTLARTIDGEIRTQDAPFVARSLLMAVHAREQAWAFVKKHWDTMDRLYPKHGLRRMAEGVVGLATPELEADVHRFFNERRIDLGGKTLEQYLEQLRVAVALREREGSALSAYLARS